MVVVSESDRVEVLADHLGGELLEDDVEETRFDGDHDCIDLLLSQQHLFLRTHTLLLSTVYLHVPHFQQVPHHFRYFFVHSTHPHLWRKVDAPVVHQPLVQ